MIPYEIIMIGHLSKDVIIDYIGNRTYITGGAVVYSSMAAAHSEVSTMVITKMRSDDRILIAPLQSKDIEWVTAVSPKTTSIQNVYHTADKERRDVTLLSQADPFRMEDIPEDEPWVYQLAGLFGGEIPDTLIKPLALRSQVALDAQGVLRCIDEQGSLVFHDWVNKRELLPYVTFFKVDAAEAEILTGMSDRVQAAKTLQAWGADEVMLTHNTEVLVCGDGDVHSAPFTNSNTSGRTGRGDTTFAAYLAWRGKHDIHQSLRYAAALCSIKMESPGPFCGSVDEVLHRMEQDRNR